MRTLILLMLSIILSACGEAFIGDDPDNTPETNFELLWHEYDKWFAQFDHRGIDWQAQYDIYRPQITAQTSQDELWTIVTTMMSVLEDSHSTITWPDNKYFNSEPQSVRDARKQFNLSLVSEYLTEKGTNSDNQFYYGKLNGNIGYIYIAKFDGKQVNDIVSIVNGMGNIDGMIIDVRSSPGGNDWQSHKIASVFADQPRFVYSVQTRNGPGHNDFDQSTAWNIMPSKQIQFTRPIVLLTNRASVSATDVFALIMSELPHVTIIGDYSTGAFSDKSFLRFLPNGWMYTISHQRYFNSSGENLEGVGVKPDVFVKANQTDLQNGVDNVLESAVVYLKELI